MARERRFSSIAATICSSEVAPLGGPTAITGTAAILESKSVVSRGNSADGCGAQTSLALLSTKVIRQFVSRLIQLNVVRAGHDHHDDPAVLALLNRTAELRAFRPQLADGRIDIVAHQCDRVMARVIIGFPFPLAVRRVHAHL